MGTGRSLRAHLARWRLVLSIALAAFIGYLDYVTGWEMSFSIFYLAPVAMAAWWGGWRAGLFISVCAAAVWLAVDLQSARYSAQWVVYWNAGVRLGFFVSFGLLLSALRTRRDSLKEAVRQRTNALETAIGDLREETRQRLDAEDRRLRAENETLRASERELHRMGQDLHDSIQGNLVGLHMMLELLKGETHFPASLDGRVDRLIAIVSETIEQTRALAASCCPVDLSAEGLPRALRKLAETTSTVFHKPCEFCGDDSIAIAEETTAYHLYYIAREAVANALKHAQAKSIVVGLVRRDGSIVLSVEDDGVGLPAEALSGAGMGMKTMSYRANIIGGRLSARRRQGGGTVVDCTMPEQPAAPRTPIAK